MRRGGIPTPLPKAALQGAPAMPPRARAAGGPTTARGIRGSASPGLAECSRSADGAGCDATGAPAVDVPADAGARILSAARSIAPAASGSAEASRTMSSVPGVAASAAVPDLPREAERSRCNRPSAMPRCTEQCGSAAARNQLKRAGCSVKLRRCGPQGRATVCFCYEHVGPAMQQGPGEFSAALIWSAKWFPKR